MLIVTQLVAKDCLMPRNKDQFFLGAHVTNLVGRHEFSSRLRDGIRAFEPTSSAVTMRRSGDSSLPERF